MNINSLSLWWNIFLKHFSQDESIFKLINKDNTLFFCKKSIKKYRLFSLKYISTQFLENASPDFYNFELDQSQLHKLIKELDKEGWDVLHLKYLSRPDSNIDELDTFLDLNHFKFKKTIATRIYYIDLTLFKTWEKYRKSLSRNHKNEIKKRENKLNANVNWEYTLNEKIDNEDLYTIIENLHLKRQRKMGRASFLESDRGKDFLKDLISDFLKRDILVYSIIYINQQPISYTLGFRVDKVYYHWSIGFDTDYSKFSPNKVNHRYLIESCIKLGLKEFNFMRGQGKYKEQWTKTFRESYEYKITNNKKFILKFLQL